jgi:drug/metabolite transporter (DMT)-like permease
MLIARAAIFRRRLFIPLDRASLTHYTIIAALGAVLPNLFSYWAMSQLPAGIMAIIVSSVPMFALAIAINPATKYIKIKQHKRSLDA